MKTSLPRACLLAGCLLLGTKSVPAQTPAPSAPPTEKTAPVPTKPAVAPTPAPSPGAKPEGVKQMKSQFGQQSKEVLEKRQALIERLRLAKTDDEKDRIITEIRQQQKQRLDQQREIARQIREQMQASRKESLPAVSGR